MLYLRKTNVVLSIFLATTFLSSSLFAISMAQERAAEASYYKKYKAKLKKLKQERKKDRTFFTLSLGANALALTDRDSAGDLVAYNTPYFKTINANYYFGDGLKDGVSFGLGYEFGYQDQTNALLHGVEFFINIADIWNNSAYAVGYYAGYTNDNIIVDKNTNEILLSGLLISYKKQLINNFIGIGFDVRALFASAIDGRFLDLPKEDESGGNISVGAKLIFPY